ncbi:MAG: ABC transporter permease [Candidatus Nanopelagicales bacterium]|nr:ABC transporter permease [Actinomycetota bacterium]MDA9227098.1 ABC transporter permease [Actinomycetota bacterium]MDA9334425.1 ABC transporter permease [Actinomycetota bacterium]MDB0039155.1 ABC transporter permease [Actinomycetota bacterium]MDC1474673.1 ABC transporter permease [Candidatus Nanopelagicales bacterium]
MDGISSWLAYLSTRGDLVIETLAQTLTYVVLVTISASIVAIVLGVATRHNPFAKELTLSIASVFLTIPSLALFTIFIPIVGLGFAPSFIALFLYALLPIMRNTVAGLDSVDSSILESAKGMGLTSGQILRKVQLPLAWPIMLAGIRVSALLTVGISAIATLVAGGGLGDFIKSGLARLPLPNSLEAIWTGVILSLALALVVDFILRTVGRFTNPSGVRS